MCWKGDVGPRTFQFKTDGQASVAAWAEQILRLLSSDKGIPAYRSACL